jgi:precorrin-3B synthase
MATGDGLLARLLPAGPIPLDALIKLCEAAHLHGNGVIEISARGSLQVRGLDPVSAPLFAEIVAALGIELCESVPVLVDLLPGDPSVLIDARPLAAALRRAIAESRLELAPKVSVLIDGGGRIGLDALRSDIRLRAFAASEGPGLQLALAGDARTAAIVGTVPPDKAVDAVMTLLSAIAAKGREARAADLLPAREAIRPIATPRPRAEAIGLHPLEDGAGALGVGLAFGHAQAEAFIKLLEIAATHGAQWARPAPGRALLLGAFSETHAARVKRDARRLDFIVAATDPRRRIVACPGAPACASGLIAARALAAEIARDVPLSGEGVAMHVSGCAKGCAHPASAPLTIVGAERGCGLIAEGTARAASNRYVDPSELIAALRGERSKRREAVDA